MITQNIEVAPNRLSKRQAVPNLLPRIVEEYISDERQFLLSQLRYNRLLDLYSGMVCFPVYSTSRLADEIFVGIDQMERPHVFLVQASTGNRPLRISHVKSCFDSFVTEYQSALIRSIVLQVVTLNILALLEFQVERTARLVGEKHYQIV